MANIAGAGSADTRTTEQKYLDALKKYAPEMKQLNGTSLTANALANTTSPTLASVKSVYDSLYNKQTTPTATTPTVTPTTPTVSTQTATPLQAQPTTQQAEQPQQPAFDVQAYMNQLAQAKKQQSLANLQNAYNKNVSSLNSEKATVQPMYYDKRNQTSTASQLSARNLAEYMAARGQTNAGASTQGEINRNMQLQGDIGSLNRDENSRLSDIERRRSDLGVALEQDKINAESGIDSQLMQNMIDQYNTDRTRQDSLDQFNKQFGLQTDQFNYGKTQDSFNNGITMAGLTGKYNGQQTMQGRQADASYYSTLLENESRAIQNKYADQIASGQVNAQNLSNAYQAMVNANYPKEESAKIAQILAQTAGVTLDNTAQAIANKYAPQIAQGQIDGQKLQNAYQKLVNSGYSATVAAEVAAKYANIAQGNAQVAISRQNANTSAAELGLQRDKFNYDKANPTTKETKYNYKNDSSFQATYAGAIKDQAGSLAKLKADPQKFISAFGLDGFKALYTAASPKSQAIDFSFLEGLQ